jgi:predicted secreted protein
MKRARVGLLALAVIGMVVGLVGCGTTTVSVTLDDAGTIQAVGVGDRVVVRLDGTPSTGFTWSRTSPSDEELEASPLEVVSEGEYEFAGNESIPGAAGICVFEYEVARSGTVTLTYAYARSWEEDPAETFSVTIWARE